MSLNTTDHELAGSSRVNMTYVEPGFYDILDAAFVINKYYLWVILAIGFPGNLATIITIFRMRSLGSFTFYVVLLAVMDNLAIVDKTLLYQLQKQIHVGDTACKILSFLGTFFSTCANWVLVLMAIERLLAVRYPLKIQKYLGCKKSAVALCIVGVIIAGAYAPILWICSYDEENKVCKLDNNVAHIPDILHWVNISLCVFIPFTILAVCNILIIRVIRQSFRLRTVLRHIPHNALKRRKSSCYDSSIQRQIMLMLFTATLVFVVLLFPLCAFSVADSYWNPASLSREYAIKYLIYQVAYVLCDSTHAVNFCLYFLSARKFRNHFIRMSTCASVNTRQTSV